MNTEKSNEKNEKVTFKRLAMDPDHELQLDGKYKDLFKEIHEMPINIWLQIDDTTKKSIKDALDKCNLRRVIKHEGNFLHFDCKKKGVVYIQKLPLSELSKIQQEGRDKAKKKNQK